MSSRETTVSRYPLPSAKSSIALDGHRGPTTSKGSGVPSTDSGQANPAHSLLANTAPINIKKMPPELPTGICVAAGRRGTRAGVGAHETPGTA